MSETQGKLQEMLKHVEYEVGMLQETARELPRHAAGTIQNSLVDSFVIHARSIDEFLYTPSRDGERITGWDYVDEWSKVRTRTLGKKPKQIKDLWVRASHHVAHVMIQRLQRDQDRVYWEVDTIRDTLLKVYATFTSEASKAGWTIKVLQWEEQDHAETPEKVMSESAYTTTTLSPMLPPTTLDDECLGLQRSDDA